MAYNKKAYIETKEFFAKKHNDAKNSSFERTEEIYAKIPEIRKIDRELSTTCASLIIEITKGKEKIDERINKIKEINLALQSKRAELLKANGFSADYTDIKYECDKCEDTGFTEKGQCECFRHELIKNTIRASGIGSLVDTQTFDSFQLKYYTDNTDTLKQMKGNLDFIREYANTFSLNSGNLLFIGKTGLGKTHLSTSVAKTAIEKGFDVKYDTAQNILSDFEYERFSRGYNTEPSESKTDIYFDCDLLIIDDLGSELSNSFTVSAIYNLINTRINQKKPMIISTNLYPKELRERYESRITSRLFGEFDSVLFKGTDIRQAKLM